MDFENDEDIKNFLSDFKLVMIYDYLESVQQKKEFKDKGLLLQDLFYKDGEDVAKNVKKMTNIRCHDQFMGRS
jgi:hypothetical protein